MPEQFGDKQHEATPFRRQKAREEGQVARSTDLASAILLMAAVLTLMYVGRGAAEMLGGYMTRQITDAASLEVNPQAATEQWLVLGQTLAETVLPLLLVLLVVAVAAHLGQIGPLFLPTKLVPDIGHVSPLRGMKRLFSLNSAMRLTFGIFKIIVVAAVAGVSLYFEREQILALSQLELGQLAVYLGDIVFWTVFKVGMALMILAILDYAYQRWKFEQDIRMTTQEMKEELKTLQGDPQVLARRKQVQRQLALSRMGQAVPTADVVVTNPTHLAVAIKYDMDAMEAPIVVAKGAGHVAQRIRQMAIDNDIPIVERKPLAQFLFKHCEVNQQVPAEQYAAVAEVLKFVYELQGKTIPAHAA